MRSPADMKTIQIEITNACLHSCSNCTRFCGHHQSPFFMDWITFKRAVDSLQGFEGIIGLMGGEPILHPGFERMALYLRKWNGMAKNLRAARRPVTDYMTYCRSRQNANYVLNRCKGPGLWTSMPKKYYKYYELIQDTFVFQNLNDHCNPSYHQPLLIKRKELGIPDHQWYMLRDACWIQNCWSASITPKGAFFCEVAAALDMLFNGPGGWPIVSGWWQRKPEDFTDQLHWCEMCGAALDTIPRNANESIDDASPEIFDLLKSIKSPKLKKNHVHIYRSAEINSDNNLKQFQKGQYIADYSQRLGTANQNLLPRFISGLVFCNSTCSEEDISETLCNALEYLDEVSLVIDEKQQISSNISKYVQDWAKLNIISIQDHCFGVFINAAMKSFKKKDWLVYILPGQTLPPAFSENILETFLNPGILYSIHYSHSNEQDSLVRLFNSNALVIKQAGFDGIAQCLDLKDFINLWPADKQVQTSLPFKDLPSTDEHVWKEVIDQDFLQDKKLVSRLSLVMSQALPGKGNILVTQSASFFLTRALTNLLMSMGYRVYLLTHERFEIQFSDLLPSEQIFIFKRPEMIKFDQLFDFCTEIRKKIVLQGAVVPYSSQRQKLEPQDGYQDIEKVAEYVAGKIICRINIKRQFITGHADHKMVHDNPWKY